MVSSWVIVGGCVLLLSSKVSAWALFLSTFDCNMRDDYKDDGYIGYVLGNDLLTTGSPDEWGQK